VEDAMGWATPEVAMILNGAALALIGYYGWWLKGVVDVEIRGKNATIESLKTENERVTKLTSPAVSGYITTMHSSLDLMAKELADMKAKYEEAETRAKETIHNLDEAKIERQIVHEANESMAQQVRELQERIDYMQQQTVLLTESGFLSSVGLPHMGTLAQMGGTAQSLPPGTSRFKIRKEGIVTPNLDRAFEDTNKPKDA
jgi:hypothetical protein